MKKLYKAKIHHKRYLPSVNEFNYSGFYMKFSLNEMDHLKSKLFSVNKFNLFSFYESDHGLRDGSSLQDWARGILQKSNVLDFNGHVILQTFPRVLGYVFNPVSFWYCYQDEKLLAIICEVNNTFGESHNYVLKNDPGNSVITLKKYFHVSPFYNIEGKYDFDFRSENVVKINYSFNEDLQLTTGLKGQELPFTDRNLIKLFFKHPFFTMFIVFLIHVQALKLYMKKNKFYPKPEKVKCEVTYE